MSLTAMTSADAPAPAGLRLRMSTVVNGSFALFVACGAIAFIEPSPYDVAFLLALPLWFMGGFRIHRSVIPFALVVTLYHLGGFIALVPYWNEPDPVVFMLQSFYLYLTCLYFGLFLAQDTVARTELCLKAYTVSTLIASLAAIAGYLDIAGTSAIFMAADRASGTFKDPNVLGSFAILGVVYPMHLVLLGRTRHLLLTFIVMSINLAGVFLTFSRGSWGALVFAGGFMIFMQFITTPHQAMRRRIVLSSIWLLGVLAVLAAVVLSNESIRTFVLERMQGVGGEYQDPRFQYQMQSISQLIQLPLGFGPLRYRNYFDLDPHSSYVNAFASYGWTGGFAFLLMVGASVFVGLRLCFVASPYRGYAQIIFASLFAMFLQGFQIDLDHWRHVHLMLGATWGLEMARQRWLDKQAAEARSANFSRSQAPSPA